MSFYEVPVAKELALIETSISRAFTQQVPWMVSLLRILVMVSSDIVHTLSSHSYILGRILRSALSYVPPMLYLVLRHHCSHDGSHHAWYYIFRIICDWSSTFVVLISLSRTATTTYEPVSRPFLSLINSIDPLISHPP